MNIQWSELIGFGIRDDDLVAPWLMVLESLDDSTHLKIEAEGDWKVEASVVPSCGRTVSPALPCRATSWSWRDAGTARLSESWGEVRRLTSRLKSPALH